MINSPFYHATTRKYITSFGNLFNEISVQRYDEAGAQGDVNNTIKVPIAYAPKEKFLRRLNEESSIDTEGTRVKMTLPRLGFHLVNMSYDPSRKLNRLQKQIECSTDNPNDGAIFQFQPVPWNFDIELYVMTKYYDEVLQVTEQILPFFGPYFNMPIKDNEDFPDDQRSIPLVLNGVQPDEDYEASGNWDTRRSIVWTFSFTLQGYLYAETKEAPIIKQAETLVSDNCELDPIQKTTVTPDPITAGPADDFGFSIDTEILDE